MDLIEITGQIPEIASATKVVAAAEQEIHYLWPTVLNHAFSGELNNARRQTAIPCSFKSF